MRAYAPDAIAPARDAARGVRRQRDRAADRQALDEHAPALAGHLGAADQLRHRDEDVLAAQRSVLEGGVQREVAAADLEALRVARNQRERDAEMLLVAEQLLGIVHLEREADERRDRRERDVALVEREAHAEHLGAVPVALADDAVVRDRGRIRPGGRPGQRETRHFAAVGEARQIVFALLLRAVVQQQFARAERIRHADRRRQRARNAHELLQHGRLRERAEFEAAVLLRDDHAEEFLLLDEVPDLGWQVGELVRDLPLVSHAADLLDRAVEKRLLLDRQFGLRLLEQLRPVGLAAEQFAFEADRAGLERDALGLRDLRRDLLVDREQRRCDLLPAEVVEIERHRDEREQRCGQGDREPVAAGQDADADDRDEAGDRPRAQSGAEIAAGQRCGEQCEQGIPGVHGGALCGN